MRVRRCRGRWLPCPPPPVRGRSTTTINNDLVDERGVIERLREAPRGREVAGERGGDRLAAAHAWVAREDDRRHARIVARGAQVKRAAADHDERERRAGRARGRAAHRAPRCAKIQRPQKARTVKIAAAWRQARHKQKQEDDCYAFHTTSKILLLIHMTMAWPLGHMTTLLLLVHMTTPILLVYMTAPILRIHMTAAFPLT